jgi:hypothetical protein
MKKAFLYLAAIAVGVLVFRNYQKYKKEEELISSESVEKIAEQLQDLTENTNETIVDVVEEVKEGAKDLLED